ncbi:MAG: ABC transporter ATP-binding protein/permease [Synergistaceae bacterium]|nr:ABC transporter ATP-binding protein/permease [Synergistaceae bacterium]
MKNHENLKSSKSLMSEISPWILPYKKTIIIALVCMVVASILNVLPAWLFKSIIDDVLINKDRVALTIICILAVLIFVFKGIASYAHQVLINWAGQHIIMDLRIALYDHTQRMSLRSIHGTRIGEMMSRITNDVGILQTLMTNTIVNLIVNGVTFVGMLCAIFWLNWKLSVTTILMLPPVAWLLLYASKKLRQTGHIVQDRIANLTAIVQEAFSAIKIVRAFATEEQELERFRTGNAENFAALIKGVRIQAILTGVVEVLLIAALALVVWFGARTVIDSGLTPGELIAFLGYLGFLVQPIRTFMSSLNGLQTGFAATERIFETLAIEIDITEPKCPIAIKKLEGAISFRNVCFSYRPDLQVLNNINLEIQRGEKLAIVGPTGSGKSTIAELILRFYDPTEGSVAIDGYDLKDLSIRDFRKQIGIVPQDPVLMKGDLRANIAYGLVGIESQEELYSMIEEAAKIAGIHEFIQTLPEKYDSLVGERGVTLSGGQRQRIAIARAIIRNPRILILDEATSSLDLNVERQVQEAMNAAMKGRTSIVIAHRLTTVHNSDRIIVIDEGRIIEEGTHETLMLQGNLYSSLYRLQFEGK